MNLYKQGGWTKTPIGKTNYEKHFNEEMKDKKFRKLYNRIKIGKKTNWKDIYMTVGKSFGIIIIVILAGFILSELKYQNEWAEREMTLMNHKHYQVVKVIREVFGKDFNLMIRIAKAESSLRPTVVGPTNDYGLFQICHRYHDVPLDCLLDIRCNTEYAKTLFDKNGTRDWSASQHNWEL